MTQQNVDPFTDGYMKGFQDRRAHLHRADVEQDGSTHVMVYKMGYDLGYDHGVAFACNHNEALNLMLDQLLF